MEDITSLIERVKTGHSEAYEPIVHRFQDMAVGYGYAILGDWQLAQDAAQEAFVTAYLELPSLHEPQAFAGWFRRIVVKQIDRIRRKRRAAIALDYVSHIASEEQSPAELFEQHERYAAILAAIQALPVSQREVVTLFYIGAYSYNDIGVFLDIPVSTVKMRLYHARKVLQHQLVSILKEELPRQRPSRNSTFMEKIMSYQITTKVVPAQQIISVTRDCFISDLQAHLDGGIKTLTVYAQTQRVQTVGLPLAIYRGSVREDQHAAVEICLPVAGAIQATIEIAVKELPTTQVACTIATLRESIYPGALKAYEVIREWIRSNGHTEADAPREIYLSFNTSIFSPTASLDEPCVEIAWPYR